MGEHGERGPLGHLETSELIDYQPTPSVKEENVTNMPKYKEKGRREKQRVKKEC